MARGYRGSRYQLAFPGIRRSVIQASLWDALRQTLRDEYEREAALEEVIGAELSLKDKLFITKFDYHEERISSLEEGLGKVGSILGIGSLREWELMPPDYDWEPAIPSNRQKKSYVLDAAVQIMNELSENFDDLELRLSLTMCLKEKTHDIWVFGRDSGNKYLKQIASMLHDSLQRIYSEKMMRPQLEAIRAILQLMAKEILDVSDAKKAHDMLISESLEYMPVIKTEEQPAGID